MGIPGFYTWLKSTYKCCSAYNKKNVYNYIYIDVNYILHSCLSGSDSIKSSEAFKYRLFQSLDSLLCNFTATKAIILAVDGTPPYSKILLQRARRLASAKTCDLKKIGSLHLTTGTKFMLQVDAWLKQYSVKIEKTSKFLKVKCTVIPTSEPGEGELKIFHKLLSLSKAHPSRSHLVIGNDADLTVLAAATLVENIHMLIRSQSQTELLSINKLTKDISGKLSQNSYLTGRKWRTDFVILSIMMSNDYLPKINYVKFDSLWAAYVETVGDVDISNNSSMINLADTNTNKDISFNTKFLNSFLFNLIKNLPNKTYQALDLNSYNETKVKNYLEGLLWCLEMYQTGVCPMQDYFYKYNTSVSPTDLLYYVESYDVSKLKIPRSGTPAILNEVFPLIVMPKKGKILVADKYHHLIDGKLKHLYEMEECAKCTDIRTQLSVLHKSLIKCRKELTEQTLELEEDKIKKQLSNVCKQLNEHKKSHTNTCFTADDIQNIVNLASSNPLPL